MNVNPEMKNLFYQKNTPKPGSFLTKFLEGQNGWKTKDERFQKKVQNIGWRAVDLIFSSA